MPISLRPFSRRRFLALGGMAALASLGKFPFSASAKSVEKNYWALFSDTHIAAKRNEIHSGVNMADHLDAAVKELLLSDSPLPAALIVNGDCAFQSGEEADYATFVEGLSPIRKASIPIHLNLGNHDQREHFAKVLHLEKEIGKVVTDKLVSRVKSSQANWLILDSLDKTLSAPGVVGQSQLDWLAGTLDKSKHTPAIVVIHHNPFFGTGKNSGLLDTGALMDVLRPRSNAKAIVFGHTHKWGVSCDTSGIHLVNLPPVSYPFQDDQPTGWVNAMLRKEGIDLELRCIDPKHPAHAQKVSLDWRA